MNQFFKGKFNYTARQNVFIDGGRSKGIGIRSFCYLNLFRAWGGKILAIVTELAANPGMSVDNAAEFIAEALVDEFNIIPADMTFVTRLTDAESYGGTDTTERLTGVNFTWVQTEEGWSASKATFYPTDRQKIGLDE